MIRLYGALLTVGAFGTFATDTTSPMAAPVKIFGGIACAAARDGFPALRVLGVLLTLAAIGMVGDGGPSERAAVALTVAAAVALRIEAARCLGCRKAEVGRYGWRFCAVCGTRRDRRG